MSLEFVFVAKSTYAIRLAYKIILNQATFQVLRLTRKH